MAIDKILVERSKGECELSNEKSDALFAFTVAPKNDLPEHQVVVSQSVYDKLQSEDYTDENYWRFLTGSIWSEVPAVQVLSYKLLDKLSAQDWAKEALENAYLEEYLLSWANAEKNAEANKVVHKDAYGTVLQTGDSINLTENLNVKGTNFIAPKGTKVIKIRLVHDNEEQIEGKVNGNTIVILTKFVRKCV